MLDAPSPDRPVLRSTGAKDRTLATIAAKRSSRWLGSLQVWVAIILLAIVFGSALLAVFVAPYDPNEIGLDRALQAPSVQHWFGTDQLGRDVLSRVIWGGQVSLFLAACAVALAGAFGTILGLVAGYFGGVVDRAVMWIADVQFSLPAVILALVLVGAVGPSFTNIVVVLSLANWARFTRVIRSEALSLKSRDFVLLAKLGGASPLRIIAHHILPNVLGTFIVLATLDVGLIIILEATLSFLGLGVQPPDPSWGTMIADGRGYLERAWWISVFPGLALMATVLSGNLLGDALRDRLNPSLRRRW
ncbi:ABC transporter permease [Bradyrhizobium sp. NP1]|jgi:peptide/nickel transport system permease protein|uniref:ABC transporter permease n=1 Tax=Bradyrhizobium sp. NP1 TaxID=3049772 RepID=UPI0025A57D70|nr:ABC transporter permease [Bradyrhizobium sp. NP1]WJR76722.1 ABC transporter permease [Bradyrhizobium sp. NP1]